METAIEEALFGAKTSLNPIVLSLEHEVDFKVAREALEVFYLAHKSQLSAAYCISGKVEGKRRLKIVSRDDLESEKSNFQDATAVLYAVAPANATDQVVLSDLAQRRTEMVIRLSNDQLSKTGRILSPLHTDSNLDTKKTTQPAKPSKPANEDPTPTTATVGRTETSTGSKPSEPKPSEAKPSEAKPLEPKPAKPVTSTKSTSEPSSKPTGLSSFFTKGTKEDAIKFAKRDTPLKPISTVVEAEDYDQLDDELPVEPSAKKQQLENLKGMFEPNEDRDDARMSDDEAGEEQDIDVMGEAEAEPEVVELERSDMEVQQEAPEAEEPEVAPLSPEDVQMAEAEAEPVRVEEPQEQPQEQPQEPLEETLEDSAPRAPASSGPVETELDDGWSVTEFADKPEPKKPKKPASKPAVAKSKGNESRAATNLPKIPAKPQKKQSTLTSFFNKRA